MREIFVRYEQIQENIQRICLDCGRDPAEVKLMVVTKGHSPQKIQEVLGAGAKHLGENYPEETLRKWSQLGEDCVHQANWHMIGHLQSRKIPLILSGFSSFQALDSLRLAEKINLKAENSKRSSLPVLLQYNVSGEQEKYGMPAWNQETWANLLPDLERFYSFQGITPIGLMTMPPFSDSPGKNRVYFERLRKLRDYFEKNYPEAGLNELSMGTSQDYEDAIKEGATFLRIGTEIMGPRNLDQ